MAFLLPCFLMGGAFRLAEAELFRILQVQGAQRAMGSRFVLCLDEACVNAALPLPRAIRVDRCVGGNMISTCCLTKSKAAVELSNGSLCKSHAEAWYGWSLIATRFMRDHESISALIFSCLIRGRAALLTRSAGLFW